MNWDDLRYLLAAWKHRTLAGAARELRCEHTTVSRRLAALEAALGCKLFIRTPEGLAPTPAAEDLVPFAQDVERTVAAVERRAASHGDRVAGTVKLTLPAAFAGAVVRRLSELRALHPELLVEVLSDDRSLDIARGEADLAMRFAATSQREVIVKKLCDVNGAMFASEQYLLRRGTPSPPEDLRGHDVVGYSEGLANTPGAKWLAEHSAGATVVFRGNHLRALLEAAASGLGVTVVPSALARELPALRRIGPEVLCSGTLSLVVQPDLARAGRVRAVMDFLERVVSSERGLFASP